MPLPDVDIEWIVREVVRRLRDLDAHSTNGAAARETKTATVGELTISDKLVTLETLYNRLDNVKTVIVPQRAIVTPAVRDELKERGVALTCDGNARSVHHAHGSTQNKSNCPCVCVATDGVDIEALSRLCGTKVTISQTRDNSSTHEAIIAAIDTGQPAVLITSSPSAAVISANRNQNVRAAVGHDFPAVRRAIDEANANLLAIDPRGKSTTQLFGLINEFLTRN